MFQEILEMLLTILAIGYMFMDFFVRPSTEFYYSRPGRKEFFMATLAAIPSVIFHELGHKFVAMSFGAYAVYHIHPFIFLGVLMKYMGFPFIFFVPAYVSVRGYVTGFQLSMIAVAGPLVNLFVFLFSYLVCRYELVRGEKYLFFFVLMQLNKWLFLFNMLPLPGTDGYNFLRGLLL